MPNVLVVGSFTTIPLHDDHRELMQYAWLLSGGSGSEVGEITVGVNADHLIEGTKGFTPELPAQERADYFRLHGYADHSFVNNDLKISEQIFESYDPQIYLVGADWYGKEPDIMEQTGLTFEMLNWYKCSLVFAPTLNRIHSADLRKGK